jgi:hypothetical protein
MTTTQCKALTDHVADCLWWSAHWWWSVSIAPVPLLAFFGILAWCLYKSEQR